MTFTSVYMEKTQEEADARLAHLRKVDKYLELKAYTIQEGDEFRVCRKIDISVPLTTKKGFRGH